jgi:hypothetical protein
MIFAYRLFSVNKSLHREAVDRRMWNITFNPPRWDICPPQRAFGSQSFAERLRRREPTLNTGKCCNIFRCASCLTATRRSANAAYQKLSSLGQAFLSLLGKKSPQKNSLRLRASARDYFFLIQVAREGAEVAEGMFGTSSPKKSRKFRYRITSGSLFSIRKKTNSLSS